MRKVMKKRFAVLVLVVMMLVSSLAWEPMRVDAAEEAAVETTQEMTDSVSDGDAARPEADPDTESGDNPAEDVPDSREEADGFALPEDEPQELDYILGRPMTPEEEQEQYAIAEKYLRHNGWEEPEDMEIDIRLSDSDFNDRGTLPVSYDSRNVNGVSYIPAIRDQGDYGSCWAFSSLASAEAALIKKKLRNTSVDLSEAHLVYYSNFSAKDPLGNDGADETHHTGEYWDVGGNSTFAANALMNWKGAVQENLVPYSEVKVPLSQTDTQMAYGSDTAHLVGWYQIDMTDMNAVKDAIMKYGAVSISYMHGNSYYNASTAAYYCDVEQGTNHGVAVVGWDDNYSKVNFRTQPASNGAWLVRNSWNTWWGDEGYFWISYEDKTVTRAAVFDMDVADNYDNNYQYDHAAWKGSTTVSRVASVFEVKANPGKQEDLKAVGIDFADSDVNYSLQIYKNLKDSQDPASGEACLKTPVTGKTTYAGYYTIPLPQAVRLANGDEFAVVFTVAKEGSKTARVSIEYGLNLSAGETTGRISTASVRAGESFRDYGYGTWYDSIENSTNSLKIKAFTDNVDADVVKVTGITLSPKTAKIKVNEKITLSAAVAPSNATNKGIAWESSDPDIASVDVNGIVTGVSGGTVLIMARSMNGNYTASCTITVLPEIERVHFEYESYTLTIGSRMKPSLIEIYPENAADKTLKWTSSNPEMISVDGSTGEITALQPGWAGITATADNGVKYTRSVYSDLPYGGYIGNINSELYSFDLKQDEKGAYYLTGEIVVVEWVNGSPFVPKVTPTMTFRSTDGKDEIEVFVTAMGTNTYYFDRFIEGLDADKEYVFEVASSDPDNYSPYRSMNVNINTSPQMPQIKNLGRLGEQKISYYTAKNGEMRLFRRTEEYVGNINSELKWASCTTNNIGNFVTGEIVVVEWENGVSTVPFEKPIMRFKSKKGIDMDVFVTALGTNTYYFDRCLEDLDTTDEFYFTITSGDKMNTSPNKSMIVTTTDMKDRQGTLWETAKQYVKYKTNPSSGQMIIYAENK